MTAPIERRVADGTFIGRGPDGDLPGRWYPDEVAPGLSLTRWEGCVYISHDADGTHLLSWWSLGDEALDEARSWLAEHGPALRQLDWTLSREQINADPRYRTFVREHPARRSAP